MYIFIPIIELDVQDTFACTIGQLSQDIWRQLEQDISRVIRMEFVPNLFPVLLQEPFVAENFDKIVLRCLKDELKICIYTDICTYVYTHMHIHIHIQIYTYETFVAENVDVATF